MINMLKKVSATALLASCLVCPSLPALAEVPIVENNLFPSFLTAADTATATSEDTNWQIETVEITSGNTTISTGYCVLSNQAQWSPEIVMAKASIGADEELASIAKRSSAVVAVSGSDFQNYDSNTPKDPYGILVSRGRILHNDALSGEALVFTTDGKHSITDLTTTAVITIDGQEFKVAALNHTPTQNKNCITVFDQNRGKNVGFNYGTNYIVQDGSITKIQTNIDSAIPANGFVINVIGENSALRNTAKVNSIVKYSCVLNDIDVATIQAALKIEKVLIADAKSQVTDASALSQSDNTAVNRSAIGFSKDGDIILVAGVRSTIPQLAELMLKCGAEQAVSINGGASSGLIVDNDYLAEPLCNLSNAIVFKEK